MRTFGGVVDAPFLNDHLRFFEAVEDFTIQTFIPEFCSVVPASLLATAIVLPCACSTSIWRSFLTICSAASLFLAIFFLLSSSILSHRLVQKKMVMSNARRCPHHRTGRACYGIDLGLRYVDLIIARFEQVTGIKAELFRWSYGCN